MADENEGGGGSGRGRGKGAVGIDSGGESNNSSAALVIKNQSERIKINKWRVREGFPVNNSQVILLYNLADEPANKTVHKLKADANRVGVVMKRLYKEGDIVERGAPILELSECVHATVIKDMCADCGADLRQNENGNTSEASVPMIHSVPDLKVTQKLAQKLGHDDTRRLLQDRKLVLLVDLDQTVIHTTNDNVPNNIKNIYHFQLYGPHSPWYHTRLRPGTSQFLERMSKHYELHICTFGARNYAHTIAQLLDPEGKFFSHRILSRDECFNATSKTDNLKALFPNGDSMVCIIDDREDVWNMASNLIQVKPYHFFQHTGDINAPPGLSKHELDGEGVDFKDLSNLAIDMEKTSDASDVHCKEKVNDSETSSSDSPSEKSETDADIKSADADLKSADNDVVDVETTAETSESAKPINSPEPSTVETISEKASQENTQNIDKVPMQTEEENEARNVTDAAKQASDKAEKDVGNEGVGESDAASTTALAPKIKVPADPQKLIEIEDPDDYLLYLEVILSTIHTRFYSIYDDTQDIPDLKIVVPKIRSEVLRGQNLVFSGLVPTNMKLEQSRAYFIAKSLGANVAQNIGADTTHMVAVTSGTFKVNAAKKNPRIRVVNSNWLWTCAERWEHVEEKLYPLDRKTKGKQRQPPAHCHSPEHVVNYSNKSEISSLSSAQQQNASEPAKFIDTINPLLSFSNADLADMNKEFHQFFESDDSSSEDEHVNIENPPVDKTLRKRKREEKEEERTREFFTRSTGVLICTAKAAAIGDEDDDDDGDEDVAPLAEKSSNEDETEADELDKDDNDDDDDDESPSDKFRRGEKLPSDLELGSDSLDSDNNNPDTEDDGDWNMMGAALEREFLGL